MDASVAAVQSDMAEVQSDLFAAAGELERIGGEIEAVVEQTGRFDTFLGDQVDRGVALLNELVDRGTTRRGAATWAGTAPTWGRGSWATSTRRRRPAGRWS